MIINRSGIVIRIVVSELRVMGRATQGVKLINLKGNDEIASVAKIQHEDEEIEEVEDDATEDSGTAGDDAGDITPEDDSKEDKI
jgi:DNA gyrase subunit A